MRLTIHASSLKHEPLSPSIVGEFDERGGTIGRSDSNTMTLPDPERRVSRLQAEVSFSAGAFHLRNVGGSNPIIVNGRPVGPGEAVPLRHGDQVAIGEYELRIALGQGDGRRADADERTRGPVDARTVIGNSAGEGRTNPPRPSGEDALTGLSSSPAAGREDPFADLLRPPSPSSPAFPAAGRAGQIPGAGADPFADLFGAPSAPPPPRPPPESTSGRDPFAGPTAPPASRGDFDPFANFGGSPARPAPSARDGAGVEAMLGDGRSAPGSLDDVFGLETKDISGGDPMAEFLAPPVAQDTRASADPFAFLDDHARPLEPVGPAASNHTPDLEAAFRPPPIRAAAPSGAPIGSRVSPLAAPPDSAGRLDAAASGDSPTDALWRAFCEGAQIRRPLDQRLTPELMRLLGAILFEAVDGTIRLSTIRTTAKQELHVPVTTIRSKNNNPLKFAPDASAAMAQLLQPPVRGFLGAPDAMQDAMADLIGHALGTMAGTRAAMEGMLQRFEPVQLEKQLAHGGVVETLVPMNRRARLWELYLQHYGRIREKAREDFHELFGKAFVQAYEEQADAVASARRPGR